MRNLLIFEVTLIRSDAPTAPTPMPKYMGNRSSTIPPATCFSNCLKSSGATKKLKKDPAPK